MVRWLVRTRVGRVLALTAMAGLVLLAGPSASSSQDRGVTPDEVVVGTTMPLSGPAAYWGAAGRAMDAYFRWVNDQGGVHGRRIRLVIRDDGYLPARAAANVRELVERVGVFAVLGMIGTANVFAVREYLVDSRVLWISPMADASIWNGFRRKKHLFVAFPSFVEEGRILAECAARTLKTQRVGVFYQNDLYGQKGLLGVKRGLHAAGIRLAAAVPYEVTDTEVAPHALRLRESHAEAVVLYATPRHGALLVREMARVGYAPKLLLSMGLVDPILFRLAGDAWRDAIGATFIAPPDSGDARVDAALEKVARYEPALRTNPFNALAGIAVAEPFVEALRRAGRELTRERFVQAMESLHRYSGEVVRDITFGPNRRQGVDRIFLVRATAGRYERLTDWIPYPVRF